MSKTSKAGRKTGSKSKDYDTADAKQSRCQQCGSTRRARYSRTDRIAATVDPDGLPATHVVLRWTHCLACQQHRIDRTWENRK